MKEITLTINGEETTVPAGSTLMQACKAAAVEVPKFCYHKRLSIAGNCRMCLVEIEGAPKPVASCHWPAGDGMVVSTNSPAVTNARKGIMELMLVNHPLDCPVCDQGGECDLQDIAVSYGADRSNYKETKRVVKDKNLGAKISTVMSRCIHCMRCVRFATEVAGVEEFGSTGRGVAMEVGTYVEKALESELSGNMIDLCPVGALCNKPYTYKARPWELESTNTIDVMDGVGSHIKVDTRAGKVMRISPNECDEINEEWLADTGRFSCDGLSKNRLTSPMLKRGKILEPVGWQAVFNKLETALKKAKSSKISALVGDIHCGEDLFTFKELINKVLKSDNLDSRTDGAQINGANPNAYIMNTPLAEIPNADAILLIGCNPRHEAPLVNTRIKKAVNAGAQVAIIGGEIDLTYPTKNLGNDPHVLVDLLDNKGTFAKILAKAKRPMLVIGSGILTRPDAQEILLHASILAEQNGIITDNWNGFNVLQRTAGRVTAMDLGLHPTTGGKDCAGILQALETGKTDVLFIYGDVEIPPEKLQGAKTTIYIGTHLTAQAKLADIVLPAAAYTEKSGLWANVEGRVQQSQKVVEAPLHAKEDWKIFRAISAELGKPLPFDTQAQLRQQIAENCPAYAEENWGKIIPAAWAQVGKGGKMSDAPFTYPVTAKNFYQTNEILRASEVMQDCHSEIRSQKSEIRKVA